MSPARVALGALVGAALLSGAAASSVAAVPGATAPRPCTVGAPLRATVAELTVADAGCPAARGVASAWPLRPRLRAMGWRCTYRGAHPVRVACRRGEQRVRFRETVLVLDL